jgi:hypothetical protein
MTIQIKASEINNFFEGEFGNLFEKEIGICVSDEDVNILMGEMNGVMYDILFKLGFYIDGKWLFWNSNNYAKIDWWLELVFECYEGDLSEYKDSDEINLWDGFFDFGGDDDVDYNGSYIQSVNEFLQWMYKRDLLNNYKVEGESK